MAMTKKERAMVEDLRTIAALRWTERVKPDVPPPAGHHDYTSGWTYNAHSRRVMQAWSTSTTHGVDRAEPSSTGGTQGARALYSTKLAALKGLRNALERACAYDLRKIDEMIDAEMEGNDG